MLEVGFSYYFGFLKSGDRFAWGGGEFEKVSGNIAVRLWDEKVVEMPEGVKVHLYEVH